MTDDSETENMNNFARSRPARRPEGQAVLARGYEKVNIEETKERKRSKKKENDSLRQDVRGSVRGASSWPFPAPFMGSVQGRVPLWVVMAGGGA